MGFRLSVLPNICSRQLSSMPWGYEGRGVEGAAIRGPAVEGAA